MCQNSAQVSATSSLHAPLLAFPLPPPTSPSLSQFPNWIISSSWPRNMEVQDMYPVLTSTYTFPTGTKVEVPCFAPNTVVEIQRTECPDSFVNPMDVNNAKPCVNVCIKLNPSLCLSSYVHPNILHACTIMDGALSSGSLYRRGIFGDVGYAKCYWTDWPAVQPFSRDNMVFFFDIRCSA